MPYLYMSEHPSLTDFEGGEQQFQCKALFGFEEGQKLDWKWKYGKTALESQPNITIETDAAAHETRLVLKNLKESQRGDYKCIVHNKYGSHSRTIKLRIKSLTGSCSKSSGGPD